jgi:hypothetical protein
MPVTTQHSPGFMAVFSVDPVAAGALLPPTALQPLRLWNRGLLVIAVMNYRDTCIGKYIEFNIGIMCTRGSKPAPRLLPGLLMAPYGTGQYCYDLPVSTEISVKGGRGIWGMPKRQANLDFTVTPRTVGSRYDLDGQLVMQVEIDRPRPAWVPMWLSGAAYGQFRGMLFKSKIHCQGRMAVSLRKKGSARLTLGDHPQAVPLKSLDISPDPLVTAYFPALQGVLDDHVESWFLRYDQPPQQAPEGLAIVANLGLSQEWLAPPGSAAEAQEAAQTREGEAAPEAVYS